MAQTKEQLRKLRQKFHLGEYRNKKAKVNKGKSSNFRMARKRVSRKSSRKSYGGSGMTSMVMPILVGFAYEQYLSPKLPLSGQTKNIAETAGAYLLSKKGGIVGSSAKVIFILEAVNLLSTFTAGGLGGSSSGIQLN